MSLSRALFAASALALCAPAVYPESFGVDAEAGYRSLSASKSASAVFGSSGGLTLGGSAQYAFKKGVFVRGGFRHFGQEGERVFLANASSPAFPLGFPLKASVDSIDVIGGWRFKLGGQKPSPFVPYLGLGLELASYKEESTVAGLVEKNDQSKAGFQMLGGVEYKGFGQLVLAAEVAYALVPNALGIGGVSQIYGEDDIGGFRVVARLGYRFR